MLLALRQPLLAFAQRRLHLLHRGDVDAQPHDAAAPHPAVGCQDPAAVAHPLLEGILALAMSPQSVDEPCFLPPNRIEVAALREALSHQFLEGGVGASRGAVERGVGFVEHDQPIFPVVDHEAFGDALDRVLQQRPLLRGLDFALGALPDFPHEPSGEANQDQCARACKRDENQRMGGGRRERFLEIETDGHHQGIMRDSPIATEPRHVIDHARQNRVPVGVVIAGIRPSPTGALDAGRDGSVRIAPTESGTNAAIHALEDHDAPLAEVHRSMQGG